MSTVESTLWGMASGVAVVLGIVLGLAEIAPASCQPQQDAGAISARSRTMPKTTITPDAIPHSVLPTVFDHCTPTIRGKTTTFTFPYPCTPPPL